MPPAKRARPSFSPPRPGKKSTTLSTSATKQGRSTIQKSKEASKAYKKSGNSAVDKYKGLKGTRQAMLADDPEDDDEQSEDPDDEEDEQETPRSHTIPTSASRPHNSRPRSKSKPSTKSKSKSRPSMNFIDDEASASASNSENDDDDMNDDDEEENQTSTNLTFPSDQTQDLHVAHHDDSPSEPDMILAEITDAADISTSQSPIPEALVHKMLTHHFSKNDKTKMSKDARDLVGKYIEVFVREAIIRSAFEREERDSTGTGGIGGGGGGSFLEVEDLERAAVQLCLDF